MINEKPIGGAPQPSIAALTRRQIRELVGEIEDSKAAAILATGATAGDLEVAVAWAAGESDVQGEAWQPASPLVAVLYAILTADDAADGTRR